MARLVSLKQEICFVLCLMIGSVLAPAVAATTPQAEQEMDKGHRAFRQGDFQTAAVAWAEAAKHFSEEEQYQEQLGALLGLAESYRALGRHRQSLQTLKQAITLAENIDDRALTASVMGSLGVAYFSLGISEQATKSLEESIALAKEVEDAQVAAVSLNNLGNLLTAEEQYQEALSVYSESVALARESSDSILEAKALTNAARSALQTDLLAEAQKLLSAAFEETQALTDSHEKALGMISIGQLFRRVNEESLKPDTEGATRAYTALSEARRIAEALNDRRVASYALGYLGQLYEARQRYDEALRLTQQAEFMAQLADAPESLYLWQWQIGRILRATRDFAGAIDAYRRAVYNLQSIRQDLLTQDRSGALSFRNAIAPVFFELADLLLQRPGSLSDEEDIERHLVEARNTIEQFKTAELQDYFQDECVTELQARITPLDRVEPQTAIVYPILLENRTELLVSLPDRIRQFTLPVGAETLTAEIRAFRASLEKRTSHQYLPHAKQLHQWLVRPLEAELAAQGVDTLVFIPGGALRTIPMAALHDGKQFLIHKYAFANTPGLQLTDARTIQRERVEVLLNGLTESVQGFPALPYVSGEVENIRSLFSGKLLLNQDFRTPSMETELTRTPYSIVHVASHAQFESDPRQTFLLTYDDKLTMDRLEGFMGISQYRDQPVELLALSACQTAAGDDRAALGLAGVAIKAGARSALATLWFINDEASSLLVSEFYRRLTEPGVSKAKALQQAQLTLLNNRRYRHPAYWSPFLLIGNWL